MAAFMLLIFVMMHPGLTRNVKQKVECISVHVDLGKKLHVISNWGPTVIKKIS